MKKNVFWMALISLAVMMSSTVFISCDKEDDEKDGSLIGEWIDEDEIHYIFNEDGTWRTFSNDPADLWSEEGTYVYKGGVIYFDSDDEEFLEAKVIKLTATELILEIAEDDGRTSRLNLKRTTSSTNDDGDDDDDDDDEIQDKTLTVTVENGTSYSGKIDIVKVETYSENDGRYVSLLSVPYNNGAFTLNLPASLDDQYTYFPDLEDMPGVKVSNPNVKTGSLELYTYKSDDKTGYIYHGTGGWQGGLIYADGSLSITGSYTETYGEETETVKYNCNLQKGWNMAYGKETQKAENLYEYELTTQAPEGAKWYFEEDYYSSSKSGSLQKQAPLQLSAKHKSTFIK